MRELTYFVAISLDGRIASPQGEFTGFSMQGDHIDRIARDYPETLPAPALAAMGVEISADPVFDTVLMGWNTYAIGLEHGLDSPYPHLRQIVFTHRDVREPSSIHFTSEDPTSRVQELKREPGRGIWLCGGGQLAATLAEEIDHVVLKVNPVVLGDGIPLFAAPYQPRGYVLEHSDSYASGVVVSSYRPA